MDFEKLLAQKQKELDLQKQEIERMLEIKPTYEKVMEMIKENELDLYVLYPELRPKPPEPSAIALSVKDEIEILLNEKNLSITDLFPQTTISTWKAEAKGPAKRGRKPKDGNDKPPYDPNNPETFESRHWKELGLAFKTFPKGETGTIVDEKNGKEWKYAGRGWLDDDLKAFRIRLFKEGAKEIPYK